MRPEGGRGGTSRGKGDSYPAATSQLPTQRVDDELRMAALLHHSTLRDHGDDISILERNMGKAGGRWAGGPGGKG